MITGKNKEQFEKWCINQSFWDEDFYFSQLYFEMQIGVYLAYYDSLGYQVVTEPTYMDCDNNKMKWMYTVEKDSCGGGNHGFETRNEAYKEALKSANKLVNND